jgi:hypothetical protein
MKIVKYTLFFLAVFLLLTKVILPKLVSANSDAAILAAVVLGMVAVYYTSLFIKEKFDE